MSTGLAFDLLHLANISLRVAGGEKGIYVYIRGQTKIAEISYKYASGKFSETHSQSMPEAVS